VVLTVLAAIACFAGNTTTFYLFGFGLLLTLLMAAGTTALPLVVGTLPMKGLWRGTKDYNSSSLCWQLRFVSLDSFSLARPGGTWWTKRMPLRSRIPTSMERRRIRRLRRTHSSQGSESKIRQTLGEAVLMIMIAADLVLVSWSGCSPTCTPMKTMQPGGN